MPIDPPSPLEPVEQVRLGALGRHASYLRIQRDRWGQEGRRADDAERLSRFVQTRRSTRPVPGACLLPRKDKEHGDSTQRAATGAGAFDDAC